MTFRCLGGSGVGKLASANGNQDKHSGVAGLGSRQTALQRAAYIRGSRKTRSLHTSGLGNRGRGHTRRQRHGPGCPPAPDPSLGCDEDQHPDPKLVLWVGHFFQGGQGSGYPGDRQKAQTLASNDERPESSSRWQGLPYRAWVCTVHRSWPNGMSSWGGKSLHFTLREIEILLREWWLMIRGETLSDCSDHVPLVVRRLGTCWG